MTTYTPQNTIVPACRQAFRRFLRAQRSYRNARDNFEIIAAGGLVTPMYVTARELMERREAAAEDRREQLIRCLEENGRPASDILNQPGLDAPTDEPVPPPDGIDEETDETVDLQASAAGERCGAESKNFARYGYCDRPASKDGGYCYQHA